MTTRRDDIVKANIAFMYGRDEEAEKHDLDKRSYVRSKRAVADDSITSFEGEFDFLATDFLCDVFLAGCSTPFPSVEHALQASKTPDPLIRQSLLEIKDTRELKRTAIRLMKSHSSTEKDKWNDRSASIAEQLLRDKFIRHKPLCARLMSTDHRSLINENNFQDKFWGKCRTPNSTQSVGLNKLGKCLEKVRLCIEEGRLQECWIRDHFQVEEEEKISICVSVKRNGVVMPEFAQSVERKNVIEVGKSSDNDILLDHPTASRLHALLVVDKERGLMLVDLKAANGTRVDGEVVTPFVPVKLKDEGLSVVRFAASSREYSFTVDSHADMKRNHNLYARLASNDPVNPREKASDSSRSAYGGGGSGNSPETTVFVGNLAYSCTESAVRSFFSSCGEVSRVALPRDRDSGEGKGIAFVTFSKIGGLYKALMLDGDELGGREVKVKRSEGGKGRERRDESKDYSTKGDVGHYGPSAAAPVSVSRPQSSSLSSSLESGRGTDRERDRDRDRNKERDRRNRDSDRDRNKERDRRNRDSDRDSDKERGSDRGRGRDRRRVRDEERDGEMSAHRKRSRSSSE